MPCPAFDLAIPLLRISSYVLHTLTFAKRFSVFDDMLKHICLTQKKSVMEELKRKKDMTYRKQIANGRNKSLCVITLKVNGLNSPLKRQRLSELIFFFFKSWFNYAVYKRLTLDSKTKLKVNEEKKTPHANSNQKRAGLAILISDVKTKIVT